MAAPCGPNLPVEVLNGGRARAGKRPVSEYGPGARREQPGEVPGLPHQRISGFCRRNRVMISSRDVAMGSKNMHLQI